MPSVYDRILSCFARGLGYPEDFFCEVCSFISHGPFIWVPCDLHDTLLCAGALHVVCTKLLRCTCSTKYPARQGAWMPESAHSSAGDSVWCACTPLT